MSQKYNHDGLLYWAPTPKLGGGWICHKDSTTQQQPADPQSGYYDATGGWVALPGQQQTQATQQQAVPTATQQPTQQQQQAAPTQQGITTGNVNTLTANAVQPQGNMSVADAYSTLTGRAPDAAGQAWWNTQAGPGGMLTPTQQREFAAAAGANEPVGANTNMATTRYNTLVDTTPYAQDYRGIAAPTTVDNQMPQSYYPQADQLLSYTNQAIQKALDVGKARIFSTYNTNGQMSPDGSTLYGGNNLPNRNLNDEWTNSADYKALTGSDRNAQLEATQRLLGLNRTNDYGLGGFRASDNVDLNSILIPGTPEYMAQVARNSAANDAATEKWRQSVTGSQAAPSGPQGGGQGWYGYGGYGQGGYGQGSGNNVPGIQPRLDTSNVPNLVGGDKLRDAQLQAQDAAYKMQQGYLDPQWANQEHDLQNQLIQQGIMQGSEAWDRAMSEQSRNKTFAYTQALNNSVGLGNTSQNMLFNQGLAANQNAFGQALSQGQFANQAQGQGFNQSLATNQNNFNQGLQNAQLNNASSSQAFNQSLAQRQQQINELMAQQQNPLSVLNQLMAGSQATTPTFGNVPGVNQAGTDYAGLVNSAYGQQMGQYNAGVAQNNSMMNGLYGLGSAGINSGWLSGLMSSMTPALTTASVSGGLGLGGLAAFL